MPEKLSVVKWILQVSWIAWILCVVGVPLLVGPVTEGNTYKGRKGWGVIGRVGKVYEASDAIHCSEQCTLTVCSVFLLTVLSTTSRKCVLYYGITTSDRFSPTSGTTLYAPSSQASLIQSLYVRIDFPNEVEQREDGLYYYMADIQSDLYGAREYCSKLTFPHGPWRLAMFKTKLQALTLYRDYVYRKTFGEWTLQDLVETSEGAEFGDGTLWADVEASSTNIMRTTRANSDYVLYAMTVDSYSYMRDRRLSQDDYYFVCQANPHNLIW